MRNTIPLSAKDNRRLFEINMVNFPIIYLYTYLYTSSLCTLSDSVDRPTKMTLHGDFFIYSSNKSMSS